MTQTQAPRPSASAGEDHVLDASPRDGSHGYLFFENPKPDSNNENSQLVDGPALGKLLADTDTPVLILNACRSAHADIQAQSDVAQDVDESQSQVRAFGSLAKEVMNEGVAGVVVEIYSPATGQAAALRRSLPPLAVASAATMSDVILTTPASPRKEEVARGGAWLEPLALDVPVQGQVIGANFELYRAQVISPWYRLRAELEDRLFATLFQ